MSDYQVTSEETRSIVEAFLKVNPSLTPRWGNRQGDWGHVFFEDDSEFPQHYDPDSPDWVVQFVDPMGNTHDVDHAVILKGLSASVYADTEMESTAFISTWVMLQTAKERKTRPLPAWGPSRIVQLGLFSDAAVRFPYGGHSLLDQGPKERLEFLEPSEDAGTEPVL
ncbi:hypothetical protein ACFRAA_23195 [[Kitasatospora] papulosa]|uniref:hypothetical protein n=1 Tax=[Kitasatospora] papulosa TaxID=1464011 RepID=UPI0036277B5D